MYLVVVFFVFTCIFLITLVMIQTGKGGMGGMFGGGGSSQSPFGSGTADIMTTITKYSAISFMILSLLLSYLFAKKQSIISPDINDSAVIQTIEDNTNTEENKDKSSIPLEESAP